MCNLNERLSLNLNAVNKLQLDLRYVSSKSPMCPNTEMDDNPQRSEHTANRIQLSKIQVPRRFSVILDILIMSQAEFKL